LTKKFRKPVECYKEAHGELVVTPEEKAAWEKDFVKPAVINKVTVPTAAAKKEGEAKKEAADNDGGDDATGDDGNNGGGNDDGGDGGNGGGGFDE